MAARLEETAVRMLPHPSDKLLATISPGSVKSAAAAVVLRSNNCAAGLALELGMVMIGPLSCSAPFALAG